MLVDGDLLEQAVRLGGGGAGCPGKLKKAHSSDPQFLLS